VPVGFTVPAPTAIVTTDDDFEITTVTLSFAGTAPSGQNDFSLNYSFSVPKSGNMVDLKISSDDTASVTAASKTANSTLHTDGWARSDWIQSPTGTETQITGTFETIGGPYDLTVTVMIVRSLSGKVYGVDFVANKVRVFKEGPYEITEYAITCTGSAPYGSFRFVATETILIPEGGNWTEIASIAADDNAHVSIGNEISQESSPNQAQWTPIAPDQTPVTVELINVGGPYSLTAIIHLKKSLRFLITECVSTTHEEFLAGKVNLWRRIGIGETAYIRLGDKDKNFLDEGVLITIDGKTESAPFTLETDTVGTFLVRAMCPDGEILEDTVEIVEPTGISLEQIANPLYTEEKQTTDSNGNVSSEGLFRANQLTYIVRIHPTDVSFYNVWVWELEGERSCSGIAAGGIFESITTHRPTEPVSLDSYNSATDTAGVTEGHGTVFPLVREDWENLSVGTEIGKFIWTIPVKWQLYEPNSDNNNPQRTFSQLLIHTTTLTVSSALENEISTGVDTITTKHVGNED